MKTIFTILILAISLFTMNASFAADNKFSQNKAIEKENIAVYPNPIQSKGTIVITSDDDCEATIEFFDITGKRAKALEKQKLAKGEQQITFQTDDIKNGIYFCKVRSEHWMRTIRIVIKH